MRVLVKAEEFQTILEDMGFLKFLLTAEEAMEGEGPNWKMCRTTASSVLAKLERLMNEAWEDLENK